MKVFHELERLEYQKVLFLNMASQDYLIAIALIEQNLVRAMPLGGKEIKDNLEELENFKKLGEEVILNPVSYTHLTLPTTYHV